MTATALAFDCMPIFFKYIYDFHFIVCRGEKLFLRKCMLGEGKKIYVNDPGLILRLSSGCYFGAMKKYGIRAWVLMNISRFREAAKNASMLPILLSQPNFGFPFGFLFVLFSCSFYRRREVILHVDVFINLSIKVYLIGSSLSIRGLHVHARPSRNTQIVQGGSIIKI